MSGREQACLFAIFGINGGRGEDELRALLRECNAPFDDNFSSLEKIVTDGDTSFYLGQYSRVAERMDEYREVMGDFFPEFEDLYKDKETFLSAFTLKRPQRLCGAPSPKAQKRPLLHPARSEAVRGQ